MASKSLLNLSLLVVAAAVTLLCMADASAPGKVQVECTCKVRCSACVEAFQSEYNKKQRAAHFSLL